MAVVFGVAICGVSSGVGRNIIVVLVNVMSCMNLVNIILVAVVSMLAGRVQHVVLLLDPTGGVRAGPGFLQPAGLQQMFPQPALREYAQPWCGCGGHWPGRY